MKLNVLIITLYLITSVHCAVVWLVSIGDAGHFTPMRILSKKMEISSHDVKIFSDSKDCKLTANCEPIIWENPANSLLSSQQSLDDVVNSTRVFVSRTLTFYKHLRASMLTHKKPDLLICDVLTFGCNLVATDYSIPVVVNNPSLYIELPIDTFSVPFPLSTFPSKMTLSNKIENVALKLGFMAAVVVPLSWSVATFRIANNIPFINTILDLFYQNAQIVNSCQGFFASRLVPQNVFYSGPLMEEDSQTFSLIPKEDPVIIVSLGTVIKENESMYKSVLTAFEEYCMQKKYFLIFTGNKHGFHEEHLHKCVIQSYAWLNLTAEFQYKNVKLFISHGGANSIQQAVFYGIPQLCVPFYGDQFQNCITLHERVVGIYVKSNSTLRSAIEEILQNKTFQDHITSWKRIYQTCTKINVLPYIDHAMAFGFADFSPLRDSASMYFVALVILFIIGRHICHFCARRAFFKG